MQYSSKNSSDMKNLMRRAPNIEFSRPPSFRDAKCVYRCTNAVTKTFNKHHIPPDYLVGLGSTPLLRQMRHWKDTVEADGDEQIRAHIPPSWVSELRFRAEDSACESYGENLLIALLILCSTCRAGNNEPLLSRLSTIGVRNRKHSRYQRRSSQQSRRKRHRDRTAAKSD